MKIHSRILGNAQYPIIKFRITNCWGYDSKNHREKKGLCFYLFKKILIIGISFKTKPLKKGYTASNSRIVMSTTNKPTDETKTN